MSNPFILQVIPSGHSFANRILEIKELTSHAINGVNVVLFSPRRYGKTSLAQQIQADLKKKGFYTIYVDFFLTTSVDEVAGRIAKSVYSVLHKHESLLDKRSRLLKVFKTFRPVLKPSFPEGVTVSVEPVSGGMSGIDLLDKVLGELGQFIDEESVEVHIVFDEFQEITEVKEPRIEGILRKHIQNHQASYFFVGSRRRILLNIFSQRNRPFYQSAIMYSLKPLPHEEVVLFLIQQFKSSGKICPMKIAEAISERTFQYPYYVQCLAYNVFEVAGKTVFMKDVDVGFEKMLASERYGYESTVQGLTVSQIAFLKALALDPNQKVHTSQFMSRHKLTLGGIQSSQKKLVHLDLIEKKDGVWQIVDPIFGIWLARYR